MLYILYVTSHCVRKYYNLIWNVHFTFTLDNVIYAELIMTFVCTPWWRLHVSAAKCWNNFYFNVYQSSKVKEILSEIYMYITPAVLRITGWERFSLVTCLAVNL